MVNIQASLISFSGMSAELRNKQQNQADAPSGFDALLASIGAGSQNAGGSRAVGNMLPSANNTSLLGSLSGLLSPDIGNAFDFTSDFESTFGTSGPLPTFIAMMSAKLNLTAEQNKAFQDIAVNNKDIVKTPDSVQKIADELKQAGIGYNA
jgi:hypothetical protein